MADQLTQIAMKALPNDDTTIITLNKSIDPSYVNNKTAWWKKHKDEPRILECMREARRKYYYKNKEKEQHRSRQYYYKKKLIEAERLEGELQKKE